MSHLTSQTRRLRATLRCRQEMNICSTFGLTNIFTKSLYRCSYLVFYSMYVVSILCMYAPSRWARPLMARRASARTSRARTSPLGSA